MNKTFATIASISALLINSLTLTSCQSQNAMAPSQSSPVSITNAGRKPTAWKWNCEQEWIIDSIGKDIAEMLVYAKYRNDAKVKVSASSLNFKTTTVDTKANKYKFELTLPGSKEAISHEFTLDGYVWSPASYRSFVDQLIEALKLKADSPSAVPANYLKNLSDADMAELFSENERISTALSATPLDPSLHEQAALLQATFDMLELASEFSDTRPPLNRMSAHLAIAEVVNGSNELTLPGKLANIALESMSCRDGVAVTKNDDLAKSQTDDTVKSWLRALKIRSSGDYRLFDEKNQTQIEASQFGMRYAGFLTADKALAYIASHKCTPKLRWMRIAMCGQGTVASGHEIDSKIVPAELSAFADDYKLYNKQALSAQSKLVEELNRTSTRCLVNNDGAPKLVALSWGDVAAYHARHILCAVLAEHDFYQYKYNVTEMADEAIKRATALLGGSTLFPLACIDIPNDDKHREANKKFYADVQKLFIEHPELVTEALWDRTCMMWKASQPPVVPETPAELWFDPPYPMGTAYYFINRVWLDNCKPDLNELTRLRTLCPLDAAVCWRWTMKKYGQHPTGAQRREGFGRLVDFDLTAMRMCADGDYNDPVLYEKEMESIAKFNPEDYFNLAEYCVQHNEPANAKKYFQHGLDEAQDSVLAANKSAWLVNYLYDNGEKDKALSIAKGAAQVYSMGGLSCLADLYDKMGELAKAEQLFKDANERYDKDANLIGFYIRNASKDKHCADESARLVKKYFPAGIQRFDFTKLTAPPTVGVKIVRSDAYPTSIGLKENCVVVGLNGFKIDNEKQFNIIRRATLDPHIKTTYWDGHKYREVEVTTVIGNSLEVSIEAYKSSN